MHPYPWLVPRVLPVRILAVLAAALRPLTALVTVPLAFSTMGDCILPVALLTVMPLDGFDGAAAQITVYALAIAYAPSWQTAVLVGAIACVHVASTVWGLLPLLLSQTSVLVAMVAWSLLLQLTLLVTVVLPRGPTATFRKLYHVVALLALLVGRACDALEFGCLVLAGAFTGALLLEGIACYPFQTTPRPLRVVLAGRERLVKKDEIIAAPGPAGLAAGMLVPALIGTGDVAWPSVLVGDSLAAVVGSALVGSRVGWRIPRSEKSWAGAAANLAGTALCSRAFGSSWRGALIQGTASAVFEVVLGTADNVGLPVLMSVFFGVS